MFINLFKKMKSNHHFAIFFLLSFNVFNHSDAQLKAKQVTIRPQSWIGLNGTMRLSDKWGVFYDANYRTNQFFQSTLYTASNIGVNYWFNENTTFLLGYAHQWTAPTTAGWHTYANENRLYQQVLISSTFGKIAITNRFRNEERWQQAIIHDTATNSYVFSDRVRYYVSAVIQLAKKPYLPSIIVSDEIYLQMGSAIVYNTFDQNRAFIGLRESISKDLVFDIGYMVIDQEKSTGYQYDRDHLFRLYFHYYPDFRPKKGGM